MAKKGVKAYIGEQTPGLNTEITATGGAVALLKLQAKTERPLFVCE